MVNHLLRAAIVACCALYAAAASVPAHGAGADLARYQPAPYSTVQHPEWTKNASIYQLNTRQFTAAGTLRAAQQELPRLKALGTDIVWLMPVHPIGKAHRKGSLGSPYAVQDYFAINPELGTLADFKAFVAAAHGLGMYVIMDWVANHTAWDATMRTAHPEWYLKDAAGKPRPTPWFDWDDIIELDYGNPALRAYMTKAMRYWVEEAGVDGYRADAAGFVPQDFWDNAAAELRAIKPVFLLAEWESRDMHARAFDATYSWTWWDAMRLIAEGKADATSLYSYYAWNEKFYPKNAYRMLYVTNHDKNAADGTEFEVFGPAVDAAIVLSVVSDGMPMIYNGQEAGNEKRLKFFERDPIAWKASPYGVLYRDLFALKKRNTALWNGEHGATMRQVKNSAPKQVFSFVRDNGQDKVFAVFNLSGKPASVTFEDGPQRGSYREFGSGTATAIGDVATLTLAPWAWKLYVR
ncbi:alpha-amylase family glycosyl hydrolase [Pseudoduganella albidiflava]|uniref:Alpha-amlyase n=1 Tax=Pseudoduganella albidiflava TaxID=321983 RepID=A0A411WX95_9BURK|nr:alpha-amylase family glycosyl hydrolase [Pseudoduganella albidiflava]QBI01202.1 alpha-amlyase [Pseudoduganella albidiflava]GGY48931.1 alpha-amlyase [Pseudoduganella albidiflava]